MATFEELYTTLLDRELNNNSSQAGSPFSSTNRQRAINDGYQEFAALTECWVRRHTFALSCSVTEYVVSTVSDFARVAKDGLPEYRHTSSGSSGYTTIVSGYDFPRRDEIWLNRFQPGWRASTSCGTPSAWYLRNDGGQQYIGLDVPPDVGSSETASLVVPYVARPESMTASTSVPFTDTNGRTRVDLYEYHQALPHYAAYKLLPSIGDGDGSKDQLQKFLGYVQRFLANLRPKGGSHVVMARGYLREAQRGARGGSEPWSENYR